MIAAALCLLDRTVWRSVRLDAADRLLLQRYKADVELTFYPRAAAEEELKSAPRKARNAGVRLSCEWFGRLLKG